MKPQLTRWKIPVLGRTHRRSALDDQMAAFCALHSGKGHWNFDVPFWNHRFAGAKCLTRMLARSNMPIELGQTLRITRREPAGHGRLSSHDV